MLKEDLQQYGGEVQLRKTESLRSAASQQEHCMELGQMVLNRHRDFAGALPSQQAALEEINHRACELYQQYNIRISGSNGKRWPILQFSLSLEMPGKRQVIKDQFT